MVDVASGLIIGMIFLLVLSVFLPIIECYVRCKRCGEDMNWKINRIPDKCLCDMWC
jgi:hypothetical protein